MCGIVGYCGREKAKEQIFFGLEKLEYRGYDSAGVGYFENGKIKIKKAVGKLDNLKAVTKNEMSDSKCAIGHTRWATHGGATVANAHPQISNDGSVALVHNGIVENYHELRIKLEKLGYEFRSQTDTEVLANLIDYYTKKYGTPKDALARVLLRATGSFAICAIFASKQNTLFAAKKDAPLVVGKKDLGTVIASDVLAFGSGTYEYARVDEKEIVQIEPDGRVLFFTIDQEPKCKKFEKISSISCDILQKQGYKHYMLKEIFEQPSAVRKTIDKYFDGEKIRFPNAENFDGVIKKASFVHFVACGSAYHAGLVGKMVTEEIAKTRAECVLASEFRYRKNILKKNDLFVAVSQSGETADTLSAMRMAKKCGLKTVAITNVVSSTLAVEADFVLPTFAGPEIAVATTKAYSAQLAVLYLFALKMAQLKQKCTNSLQKYYISEIAQLPQKIENVLLCEDEMRKIAASLFAKHDVFFLGRGIDFFVAQEASLKLKEISYIHSEAYASGEMKHGTISLIEKGTAVFVLSTDERLHKKSLSSLEEVKCRGADVILFCIQNDGIEMPFSKCVKIPKTCPLFSASVAIIPFQFIAYYAALQKALDVDRPRNLAKSVTVE